jgi:hypothetical protein
MINKHTLLNNKQITNSAALIRDIRPKGRALVSTGTIEHDQANGRLTDFFDVVISESLDAKNKLGFSDIVFYTDSSAYRDGLFAIDKYAELSDTILLTNFGAIKDLAKLKKDLGIFNLNYIPTSCACSSVPGGPLQNELNSQSPGIHLAMVLGCTTIYTDKPVSGTSSMSTDELKSFLTAKKSIRPANILNVGRVSLLKAAF